MAIRLHGISHVWNEELLMPGFINWHKQIGFDSFTIIDHRSTDRTVGIIKEMASDWKIIPSRLEWFSASENDHEVSEVEASLPTSPEDFKIVLNVTEWLWTPHFKEKLEAAWRLAPDLQAFGSRSVSLVDIGANEVNPFLQTNGYIDYENGVNGSRRWRFAHNQDYGHYQIGRHGVDLPHTTMPEWLILYWQLAPYPACRDRKKAINTKRSPSDIAMGFGVQHGAVATDEGLDRVYEEERARSFNLLDFPLYREYYEYWRQRKDNEIQTGSTDT